MDPKPVLDWPLFNRAMAKAPRFEEHMRPFENKTKSHARRP
jgi:hypothetical protein